jgi:hypothetical protein
MYISFGYFDSLSLEFSYYVYTMIILPAIATSGPSAPRYRRPVIVVGDSNMQEESEAMRPINILYRRVLITEGGRLSYHQFPTRNYGS